MAKKIPAYTLWDWKSISAVIITILVLVLLIFLYNLKPIARTLKYKNYQGITTGQIEKIDTLSRIVQNYEGNHLIYTYAIHYIYVVDGQKYQGFEKIRKDLNTRLYMKKLKSGEKMFKVRYHLEKPERSVIFIE